MMTGYEVSQDIVRATRGADEAPSVFDVRPRLFEGDAPMAKGPDAIVKTVHDCQTGRWVSVFKAQWSSNMAYAPHYTVGSEGLRTKTALIRVLADWLDETSNLHLLGSDG